MEKDTCGSTGNTGQTSQILGHSQPVHSPWEEVGMMGKRLEIMYILLACLLAFFIALFLFPHAAAEVHAGRVAVLAVCQGTVPHLAGCEGVPGWHACPPGHPAGSSLVGETQG